MSCIQCAVGTYKSSSGAGSCVTCEAGKSCLTTNAASKLGMHFLQFLNPCSSNHNCSRQHSEIFFFPKKICQHFM